MVNPLKIFLSTLFTLFLLVSCHKSEEIGPQYPSSDQKNEGANGLWILNEGLFGWGNASVSFYDTEKKQMSNHVYQQKQETALGDVLQSMFFKGNRRFLIINNSNQIKICDEEMNLLETINGISSPRYMEELNDSVFLISSLNAKKVYKYNTNSKQVSTFSHHQDWTEKILRFDSELMIQQKSYNNINPSDQKIYKYNFSGQILDSLIVNKPYSELIKINQNQFGILSTNESQSQLMIANKDMTSKSYAVSDSITQITSTNSTVYLAGKHLWKFDLTSESFTKLHTLYKKNIYGLSCSEDGFIYLSDAKDYVSSGDFIIYSTHTNSIIDSIPTSYIPSEIYFEN
ncbi:MAG: DUF5074 domain-containing protein [Flavobacteriales bacterium]